MYIASQCASEDFYDYAIMFECPECVSTDIGAWNDWIDSICGF